MPEISHRCALCGAAIRPGAASCPNCGQDETLAAPRYEPALRAVNLPVETPTKIAPDAAPPVYAPEEEILYELDETEEVLPETETPPSLSEETEFAETVEPLPEVADEPPPEVAPAPKMPMYAPSPPSVRALDGPPPVYKKRRRSRYQPPTLKERLAGRVEQLKGASQDATRKVAPTVEQLRETSNTVLDRAAEDPSARFLLVGALLAAVALFVFIATYFWG